MCKKKNDLIDLLLDPNPEDIRELDVSNESDDDDDLTPGDVANFVRDYDLLPDYGDDDDDLTPGDVANFVRDYDLLPDYGDDDDDLTPEDVANLVANHDLSRDDGDELMQLRKLIKDSKSRYGTSPRDIIKKGINDLKQLIKPSGHNNVSKLLVNGVNGISQGLLSFGDILSQLCRVQDIAGHNLSQQEMDLLIIAKKLCKDYSEYIDNLNGTSKKLPRKVSKDSFEDEKKADEEYISYLLEAHDRDTAQFLINAYMTFTPRQKAIIRKQERIKRKVENSPDEEDLFDALIEEEDDGQDIENDFFNALVEESDPDEPSKKKNDNIAGETDTQLCIDNIIRLIDNNEPIEDNRIINDPYDIYILLLRILRNDVIINEIDRDIDIPIKNNKKYVKNMVVYILNILSDIGCLNDNIDKGVRNTINNIFINMNDDDTLDTFFDLLSFNVIYEKTHELCKNINNSTDFFILLIYMLKDRHICSVMDLILKDDVSYRKNSVENNKKKIFKLLFSSILLVLQEIGCIDHDQIDRYLYEIKNITKTIDYTRPVEDFVNKLEKIVYG